MPDYRLTDNLSGAVLTAFSKFMELGRYPSSSEAREIGRSIASIALDPESEAMVIHVMNVARKQDYEGVSRDERRLIAARAAIAGARSFIQEAP